MVRNPGLIFPPFFISYAISPAGSCHPRPQQHPAGKVPAPRPCLTAAASLPLPPPPTQGQVLPFPATSASQAGTSLCTSQGQGLIFPKCARMQFSFSSSSLPHLSCYKKNRRKDNPFSP